MFKFLILLLTVLLNLEYCNTLPIPSCTNNIDIMFAIDGSASLTKEDFSNEINFAIKTIESLPLKQIITRSGYIIFSNMIQTHLNLNIDNGDTIYELREAVKPGGSTNLLIPLEYVYNNIFTPTNNKLQQNSRKFLVFITDGHDSSIQDKLLNASRKLEERGVTIIAVEAVLNSNSVRLQNLASDPYSLNLINYTSTQNVSRLISAICAPKTTTAGSTTTYTTHVFSTTTLTTSPETTTMTSPMGETTTMTSPMGEITTMTSPMGETTTMTSPMGKTTTMTSPMGETTTTVQPNPGLCNLKLALDETRLLATWNRCLDSTKSIKHIRVCFRNTTEQQSNLVCVNITGDSENHMLEGLTRGHEYEVTIKAVFDDKSESNILKANERIPLTTQISGSEICIGSNCNSLSIEEKIVITVISIVLYVCLVNCCCLMLCCLCICLKKRKLEKKHVYTPMTGKTSFLYL